VSLQGDVDAPGLAAVAAQPHVAVNKAGEPLNPVEDRLNFELDRWSFVRWFSFLTDVPLAFFRK
jgi:hypothetical protein